MDPIQQLRKQIQIMTGELWSPARVATLARHCKTPAEALRAVQLAKRLKRRLASLAGMEAAG
jgi:hypothetical protein